MILISTSLAAQHSTAQHSQPVPGQTQTGIAVAVESLGETQRRLPTKKPRRIAHFPPKPQPKKKSFRGSVFFISQHSSVLHLRFPFPFLIPVSPFLALSHLRTTLTLADVFSWVDCFIVKSAARAQTFEANPVQCSFPEITIDSPTKLSSRLRKDFLSRRFFSQLLLCNATRSADSCFGEKARGRYVLLWRQHLP